MKHQLRKMSGAGDEVVKEWDETATAEELDAIEKEYNACVGKGYFAADLATNEMADKFNPNADTLLIPQMIGG